MSQMYGGSRVVASGVIAASAVRTTTLTMTRDQVLAALGFGQANVSGISSGNVPDISGFIIYLNITAVPGTDTVMASFEEILPDGTVNTTAIAAAQATAALNIQRVRMGRGITAAAPSQTGVGIQDHVPQNWRIRVIHSAASNFTYTLSATLYA